MPTLLPGLELFYQAFWDLIADRPAPGAMIPWLVVQTWADRNALDDDATYDLHYFIRKMDMAFILWGKKKPGNKPIS